MANHFVVFLMALKIDVVRLTKKKEHQIIVGIGNFSIKMVDDIFRAMLDAAPNIKVGVAMNEAAPKLTRFNYNDDALGKLAAENCKKIGAGHVFVVIFEKAYPINVLNELKKLSGVCSIYVATANDCDVIVAETKLGRAVLGVVDGTSAKRLEDDKEREERRALVKKLGYVLG